MQLPTIAGSPVWYRMCFKRDPLERFGFSSPPSPVHGTSQFLPALAPITALSQCGLQYASKVTLCRGWGAAPHHPEFTELVGFNRHGRIVPVWFRMGSAPPLAAKAAPFCTAERHHLFRFVCNMFVSMQVRTLSYMKSDRSPIWRMGGRIGGHTRGRVAQEASRKHKYNPKLPIDPPCGHMC